VPIDHFIVDFACLSNRLVVEVDGGTHSTDEEIVRDRGGSSTFEIKASVSCASRTRR
jgi:very-short-patch-repair endonuclease